MAPVGRSDGSVAINVESLASSLKTESLASSLKAELGDARLSMPPSYCIFQTPSILFRHRKSAFLPNCFSIGPMHRRKKSLVVTEKIKMKYLKGLLSRAVTQRSRDQAMLSKEEKEIAEQELLTNCISAVELIEKEASGYYAGHDWAAEMGEEFVKMLVLDGCFVIELFRKDAGEVPKENDDPIFSMSCMLQFLHHDLILLENQIPWLVLNTLFDQTKPPSETKSLIELALLFFSAMFSSPPSPPSPPLSIEISTFNNQEIKHILDLLRLWLVLPSEIKKSLPKSSGWQPIRSLTKLKEAGVKFMKVTPVSILDIKFNSKTGVLEIPSLLVQETTETILRNLIAYEQCLPNCKPIFISYAKVMDNLIDTTSDLEVLCKKDIWDNWLSPEDATQFFNNLYNDTYVKEFYYSALCNELNQYCKSWRHRWRAYYVQNYFSRPWAIAAQIYAVVIFILTLWQTILTLLQTLNKHG